MLKDRDKLTLYETYLNAKILSVCKRIPAGAARACALKQIKDSADKYFNENKITEEYYKKTFSKVNMLELSVCILDVE